MSDAEEGLIWFWFGIRFILMESAERGGGFDLISVLVWFWLWVLVVNSGYIDGEW